LRFDKTTAAVHAQMEMLDFSPAFQFGHPCAFKLANKVEELIPEGRD
jgi:beta-alanine--pyruvate transaminase